MHQPRLCLLATLLAVMTIAPAPAEEPRTPSPQEKAEYFVNKGDHARAQKDWEAAVTAYQKAREFAPQNVAAHLGLGWARNEQEQYQSGFAWFRLALKLDPDSAEAYHGMGLADIELENYNDAVKDYSEAIKRDPSKAFYFSNRAYAYSLLNKHDQAIADFSAAIRLEPKDARYWNNRGDSYLDKNDPALAVKDLNEAIRLDPKLALAYRARSEAHAALGDQGKARQDVATFERLDGDRQQLDKHYLRAKKLREQLRFEEAIEPAEMALALSRKIRPPQHFEVARLLDLLARCLEDSGQFGQAEPYYEESLRMFESLKGKSDPEVGLLADNLGQLYLKLGRPEKALVLFRRALAIAESDGFELTQAISLNTLAAAEHALDHDARAAELLRRAQRLIEPYEPDSNLFATILTHQASLLPSSQDAAAEDLLKRASKVKGQSVQASGVYHALGELYLRQKRLNEAEANYQRAFDLEQQVPDHAEGPWLAFRLASLGIVHAFQERWEEAARDLDKCNRLMRRHATGVLSSLTEGEQVEFLQRGYQGGWHQGLSLALTRRKEDAEVRRLSANWVLNRKAVAQEVLANRILMFRAAEEKLADLAKQLAESRADLARLTYSPGQEPEAKIKETTEKVEALSKEFARAIQRPTDAAPWVDWRQVQKKLPAKSVLIEFAKFHRISFADAEPEQKENPWYGAWVIAAGQADPILVDLGSAATIDEAVETLQEELRVIEEEINANPLNINGLKRPERERRIRGHLDALATLVLKPLRDQAGLDQAERWLISPDAQLWLVPWAALPVSEDCYAIEQHTVSLTITGRELLNPSSAAPTRQPSLVIIEPDYGPRPPPAPRLWFPPLPWNPEESGQVATLMQRFARPAPIVLRGALARKTDFQQARNPAAVLVCTHGFSLEDEESRKTTPNPLLRCGLAFADANRPPANGAPDGILTGLEVVGLDLRGTELVLLDSCQTARGEVRTGEGIASLAHAFHLAGAHSAVSTLWQVPHRLPLKQPKSLTIRLLENCRPGVSKADALRAAQQSLIDELRAEHRAAHPFLWAAYTLTGR